MWGAIIGGGLSLAGSLLGAREQRKAAEKTSDAVQFDPWNVNTGFGSSLFQNGTASVNLSDDYSSLRNTLFDAASGLFSQAQSFDPQHVAQNYYNQATQLVKPQQDQQALGLENRLFQQGMLGSSAGAARQRALFDSFARADNERALASIELGQNLQDRLFGRGFQALQGMSNIDQQALQALTLGGQFGGMQSNANYAAAQFPWQAAMNRSDMISGLFGGVGSVLGDYLSNR